MLDMSGHIEKRLFMFITLTEFSFYFLSLRILNEKNRTNQNVLSLDFGLHHTRSYNIPTLCFSYSL